MLLPLRELTLLGTSEWRLEEGEWHLVLIWSCDLTFVRKVSQTATRQSGFCLNHSAWGKIRFAGIYGPNESASRAVLWNDLSATLDSQFRWHLMGDFNMIEIMDDHVGGEGKVIYGREARAWANLVRKYNLMDTFVYRAGHLRFSWDNQRTHRHDPTNIDGQQFGRRILRRLDRLYAPRPSRISAVVVYSTILPGFALSDHAPIVGTFKMGVPAFCPSCHRMNLAHLQNTAFCNRINLLWEQRCEEGTRLGWESEKILH